MILFGMVPDVNEEWRVDQLEPNIRDLREEHQKLFNDTVRGVSSTSYVPENGFRDVKDDIGTS